MSPCVHPGRLGRESGRGPDLEDGPFHGARSIARTWVPPVSLYLMGVPLDSVRRYAAFSSSPYGGNPAGVILNAEGLDDQTMQQIAADVGYSETAFLTGRGAAPGGSIRVRCFSPQAEVGFCGHARIATGVALGEVAGDGEFRLATNVGPILLTVTRTGGEPSGITATFESPPTTVEVLAAEHQDRLLATLGWARDDLHPLLPPMIATAGNRHPVLVAAPQPADPRGL